MTFQCTAFIIQNNLNAHSLHIPDLTFHTLIGKIFIAIKKVSPDKVLKKKTKKKTYAVLKVIIYQNSYAKSESQLYMDHCYFITAGGG